MHIECLIERTSISLTNLNSALRWAFTAISLSEDRQRLADAWRIFRSSLDRRTLRNPLFRRKKLVGLFKLYSPSRTHLHLGGGRNLRYLT